MLGDAAAQGELRSRLLLDVPELARHGQPRKANYIRHYPDVGGVEITVGISQRELDCRLVLKGDARRWIAQARTALQAVAEEAGSRMIERPGATSRQTFVIYLPSSFTTEKEAVSWTARTLNKLLEVRRELTR